MDNKKMNQLMMELYANAELKEEFIVNPQKVMADKGIEVPEDIETKVLEETEKTKYIVLPSIGEDEIATLDNIETRNNKCFYV